MHINYIILAHKNPRQVARLISRLYEPWTKFYIHIDKNVSIKPFKDALVEFRDIYFLLDEQRQVGTWGDIAIVKATLTAMNQIKLDQRTGYTILMSGQDYPLKDNQFIQDFLKRNYGTQFLAIFPLPQGVWPEDGVPRISHYKINHSNKRGDFSLVPSIFDKKFYSRNTLGKLNYLRKKKLLKVIVPLILKPRKFPVLLSPYGGGVYFAFTKERILDILSFTEDHPDYLRFHEYTLCADEIFFHSILYYFKTKKNFPIAPSVTYVNWERKTGPRPATFNIEDKEELLKASGNKLFARKFDIQYDAEILDFIDDFNR